MRPPNHFKDSLVIIFSAPHPQIRERSRLPKWPNLFLSTLHTRRASVSLFVWNFGIQINKTSSTPTLGRSALSLSQRVGAAGWLGGMFFTDWPFFLVRTINIMAQLSGPSLVCDFTLCVKQEVCTHFFSSLSSHLAR